MFTGTTTADVTDLRVPGAAVVCFRLWQHFCCGALCLDAADLGDEMVALGLKGCHGSSVFL